jgi:hypothetical protein
MIIMDHFHGGHFHFRRPRAQRRARYLALIVTALAVSGGQAANSVTKDATEIDLSGEWKLALDPNDDGLREQWFQPGFDAHFLRSHRLPGSLESQGIGNPITLDAPWTGPITDKKLFESPRFAPYRQAGQIKVPAFLQPETLYRGPAWRRRTITIPDAWQNKRVVLELERCHWTTRVWFDGVAKGSGESLSTPHRFELTTAAAPGNYDLVVRVDNRMLIDIGPYAHSVTDHTQGNWNGVVGAVRLVATPQVWIDRVATFPNVRQRTVRVVVSLGNSEKRKQTGRLKLSARPLGRPDEPAGKMLDSPCIVAKDGSQMEIDYPLGDNVLLWDEFNPVLYELSAEWIPEGVEQPATHRVTTRFAMREVAVDGTQLALNGRKLFLRGTLECNVFPLTGYPATDVASWKRIVRICREHGLNHIRFHSHCPPEAAFVAADELGMYLQVECAVWANWTASVGNGEPVDEFVYREAERIIAEYGNHPSFLLMSHGNEPAGPDQGAEYLAKWVEHFRNRDGRRLYTGGSGWPMIPANQYHVTSQPRIYAWGAGEKSRINAYPPETRTDYRDFITATDRPVVAHEIGQWCVYPNFEEIAKYTGHLKPHNFEIFRDFLEAEGLGDQARDFLLASGKLQVACYKEEIESAMRTPGYAGFALLGLSDFPGQGTALVGVVDAFWDSKPYVDAAAFRRFCGPTVPLARLDKRCFGNHETLNADVELAHYGPLKFDNADIEWRLERAATGELVDQGQFQTSAPTGALTPVGRISVPLAGVATPVKLRLVVRVPETAAENDWDLWVYSTEPPADVRPSIRVCSDLDVTARQHLSLGGEVLLTLPADRIATKRVLGFSSIFWNTSWTDNQAPHTLGILCDPEHPLFAEFPTEAHSNWQWWDLIHGAATMELDRYFAEVQPLVQVVPDWYDPKKLALVFEARVGGGSVVVTSMDLSSNLENRHAARQFRRGLLNYMAGEHFRPSVEVTVEQIESLVR